LAIIGFALIFIVIWGWVQQITKGSQATFSELDVQYIFVGISFFVAAGIIQIIDFIDALVQTKKYDDENNNKIQIGLAEQLLSRINKTDQIYFLIKYGYNEKDVFSYITSAEKEDRIKLLEKSYFKPLPFVKNEKHTLKKQSNKKSQNENIEKDIISKQIKIAKIKREHEESEEWYRRNKPRIDTADRLLDNTCKTEQVYFLVKYRCQEDRILSYLTANEKDRIDILKRSSFDEEAFIRNESDVTNKGLLLKKQTKKNKKEIMNSDEIAAQIKIANKKVYEEQENKKIEEERSRKAYYRDRHKKVTDAI
jgi:hypothetical protein